MVRRRLLGAQAKHSPALGPWRGLRSCACPSAPPERHPAPVGRIHATESLPLGSPPRVRRAWGQGHTKGTGWAWARGGYRAPTLAASNPHFAISASCSGDSNLSHRSPPSSPRDTSLHRPAHSRPFSFLPRPLAHSPVRQPPACPPSSIPACPWPEGPPPPPSATAGTVRSASTLELASGARQGG